MRNERASITGEDEKKGGEVKTIKMLIVRVERNKRKLDFQQTNKTFQKGGKGSGQK